MARRTPRRRRRLNAFPPALRRLSSWIAGASLSRSVQEGSLPPAMGGAALRQPGGGGEFQGAWRTSSPCQPALLDPARAGRAGRRPKAEGSRSELAVDLVGPAGRHMLAWIASLP